MFDAVFSGRSSAGRDSWLPSFNPFKTNGYSHLYQLDEFISNLRGLGSYFFIFIQIKIEFSVSKQWRP